MEELRQIIKKKYEEKFKRKPDEENQEDKEEKGKRSRTGGTEEELAEAETQKKLHEFNMLKKLQLTEKEEREMLYENNNEWEKYSFQITTLTEYIMKLIEKPENTFTDSDYSAWLNENPKTKLLIEYLENFIDKDDVLDDEVIDAFHLQLLQNECIIVDAIRANSEGAANDEWKTYLASIPLDLDTTDFKLVSGLGAELHTFPADASPQLTIHSLARRLEALQDW